VVAPLRISKGQDIQGACGQLVVTKKQQPEVNVGKNQLLATEMES
jgi:hypothetical protein